MKRTVEYVVNELDDADGDIVDTHAFSRKKEALRFASRFAFSFTERVVRFWASDGKIVEETRTDVTP